MSERRTGARLSRLASAEALGWSPWPEHVGNGEEGDYPYVANYGKGLPHDEVGEVRPEAYHALLRALATGRSEDFERVPLGRGVRLTNPQAGLGFDLEGRTRRRSRCRPRRAWTAPATPPRRSSCTGWP
ncbi:hypothetical protein ACIGNX_03005 [Actinosynnema sp. NPDC053489]|uniref:hypothetical protein n=1 Tax=Actinosynnema sp. NPDC053489 TaxID=3363916 RepID=UPI0037CBAD6A